MFRGASIGVLLVAGALVSTPAQARRTAIDSDHATPPHTTTLSFGGYCDYDGSDCETTYKLPYFVGFGDAKYTDRVLITGDGYLRFVGDEIDPGSTRDKFDVLHQYVGQVSTSVSLSGYGLSFDQIGSFAVSGHSFTASWFGCPHTYQCYTSRYDAKFTPGYLDGMSGFKISVNGGPRTFLPAFIPVAIPEPASWALMIGGFGLAGLALRRRAAARAIG